MPRDSSQSSSAGTLIPASAKASYTASTKTKTIQSHAKAFQKVTWVVAAPAASPLRLVSVGRFLGALAHQVLHRGPHFGSPSAFRRLSVGNGFKQAETAGSAGKRERAGVRGLDGTRRGRLPKSQTLPLPLESATSPEQACSTRSSAVQRAAAAVASCIAGQTGSTTAGGCLLAVDALPLDEQRCAPLHANASASPIMLLALARAVAVLASRAAGRRGW